MATPDTPNARSDAQPQPAGRLSAEMIALDRANVPILFGAIVALVVLLIGYWMEHRYVVLAGGFGVVVMALSWVLVAWLSLIKSFFNWFRSRHGRRGPG